MTRGRTPSRLHGRCAVLLCVTAVLGTLTLPGVATPPLSAQAAPNAPAATETSSDVSAPIVISPGGAFLRAALVPGWGHAAIGAYARGGVYFAVQSATVYTLLRARTRIGTAQDRVRLTEGVIIQELAASGVTDPESIREAFEGDERRSRVRRLLDARLDEQEDLVAFGVFVILLSAADAYVSAHLARFPEPLDLETSVTPSGGVTIGLKVPIPN